VRFGSDQIRVEYVTAVTARITLTFWQLPWEITPIEGETPVQPGRFFLYRHTLQTPTTPIIWRYTDYPAPITVEEDAEDVTYFPADIEHDKITQGYQLDDDPVTLKSFVADSHPWMLALKRMLEAPLQLDIFEVDPENPVPVLKHTGELDAPTGKGRKLAMKSTALSGALDIKVPNFYVQESCNHEWCSIGCGKDIEDYTFTATIDVIDGREITVTITVNPPASAMGADYFANGDCSIGAGSTFEGREIIRSENLGSGQQKLTIDHALRAPSIDQEVSIRPACQGTWAECSAFANTINYGGHRHVGADNISVPARETNAQGGKK